MVAAIVKVAALAVSSTVVLPYIAAMICNLAYGWPRVPNKYRRAFNPKKVYALNICIIQSMMTSLRYATLYFQWKAYYKTAPSTEIMKDRTYGCRNQKLDLYFPKSRKIDDERQFPVIMFAYGGAWGSGNKNMYGLLCSTIANKLDVIVCCANHSTYPKGHIDDMVQDLVECLGWLRENVEHYNGDKNKIILLGHSSGAHLCAMTTLEIFYHMNGNRGSVSQLSTSPLYFRDRHFAFTPLTNLPVSGNSDSDNGKDRHSSGSSNSFQVIDDGNNSNGNGDFTRSISSDYVDVGTSVSAPDMTSSASGTISEATNSGKVESEMVKKVEVVKQAGISADNDDGDESDYESDESVVTVKEGEMTTSMETQQSMVDLRNSIKAVIGLAGVYHIGDHYKHESMRGVEDISSMARAMYGPEHFDRFSPTHIVSTFTKSVRLPKIIVVHGTEDYVVPITSANRFVDELKRADADVKLRIIPSCDHYEICLDLMKSDRHFHSYVMSIIEDTAEEVFS
ncbi:hypothetical protein ACF0H5_000957 [Mactra antiquata]